MAFVVTFEGLEPPVRYDAIPWTQATIEEGPSSAGPWTVIDTITFAAPDANPAKPGLRNLTSSSATLPNGWYRVAFRDAGGHSQPAEIVRPSYAIITVERLREATGVDGHDARLHRAIAAATSAIVNYTDRDFAAPVFTGTRNYLYEGEGVLEIDDATAVSAVTINYPNAQPLPLAGFQWFAQPLQRPLGVYTWLQVPDIFYAGRFSREMGFTYNLDTLPELGHYPQPTTIDVTGTFGWPVIPEDVQQAAEWTAAFIAERHDPDKASEGISGYSQSWFPPGTGETRAEAIPQKAKDLLAPYVRVVV